MFLYGRKNFMFIFLINNINKIHSNSVLDQHEAILNTLNLGKADREIVKTDNKKVQDLIHSKQIFKIKLHDKTVEEYFYRPFVDCVDCYNDNANKSVLINKKYQKRVLNFLKQLKDADFQNKLKENADKVFNEYDLTPNEISFILFKLYHPKDNNFDQSIIDAILQSSYLEFNKKRFIELQKEFNDFLNEYKNLEKQKSNATKEQLDQINKKLREKRDDIQLSPLMILLDNLAFPVKNAINCFNVWCQSNYDLNYIPGYKSLSPAGLCYFLLCILKYSYLFRNDQENSYCLSSNIDQSKLTIINDPRFILGDFTESNSTKSPFSFYKDKFESAFLSVFQN